MNRFYKTIETTVYSPESILGEMADADYGYVGAARGKISLYRQKECVRMNIPQENAVQELVNLIRQDGKWEEK